MWWEWPAALPLGRGGRGHPLPLLALSSPFPLFSPSPLPLVVREGVDKGEKGDFKLGGRAGKRRFESHLTPSLVGTLAVPVAPYGTQRDLGNTDGTDRDSSGLDRDLEVPTGLEVVPTGLTGTWRVPVGNVENNNFTTRNIREYEKPRKGKEERRERKQGGDTRGGRGGGVVWCGVWLGSSLCFLSLFPNKNSSFGIVEGVFYLFEGGRE